MRWPVSVYGVLLQYPLQHADLAVDRPDFQFQNLCDEWIQIDIFERCDGGAGTNVRPSREENRLHAGHLPGIVSVPASGRRSRAASRIWIARLDGIRSRGHDDWIAFARIRIEVQIRRHLRAPVRFECIARSQQRLVGPLRIRFRLRLEQRAGGFELRKISPFVKIHPAAFQGFHPVIGDNDQVDGQSRRCNPFG